MTPSGSSTSRFTQARLSLLGKPLSYKAHRRDMRYRRLQAKIYNFLERPKLWRSWIYHFSVFVMVVGSLTLSVLSSITEFESILCEYALYLEVVMLVWVVTEFIIRIWSAGCRSRYQGLAGRLKFLRRPLCVIDMVLIAASVTTLIVGSTQERFATSVISGLRFFQILRMVRMDRRGGTWKLLGSVVWAHRQELVTTLYIGTLGLIFSSYFVYLAEKNAPRPARDGEKSGGPPKFSNFADALWWGVVTLCTVGYGDVVPTTWGGKVIASFSAILGISFFALPAGILGSGFALKVQQQQRQKHLNRRRVPAAELIQCLWRCYAADEHSMSVATWKPHLIPCPSPSAERPWKNNTSFVSRFSTRRRDRSNCNSNSFKNDNSAQSPLYVRHNNRRSAISNSEEEVPNVLDRSHLSLAAGLADQRQVELHPVKKENSMSSICKESEDEPDLSPRMTQLTDTEKHVIRALRKIRYFVARRKFREALRPYDVKDVIEQYSAGHVDMLGRIKNLQGRLDQILGRQDSKSKDVYESKICLASRVVKVERQVEDIESKLDLLIDLYREDRKILLQHLQIQQQQQEGQGQPVTPPTAPLKPRPILVDKQFTSEPATPTGVGHNPNRPMHRNLSDLSQRIKKRVTYRCLSLHDPPKRHPNKLNFGGNPHPLVADLAAVSQGNQGHTNPPPADPHALKPPSPLSAPPIGARTFGDAEGRWSANPEHYSPPAETSGDAHPALYSETHFPETPSPSDSFGVHAHSTLIEVTSSCLTSSVLSTLNEQRSIESECYVPVSDEASSTPSSPSASISPSDNAKEDMCSGAKGDNCNGSPPMSTPIVRIERDVDKAGNSNSNSRTDVTAVPALESLTDFHMGCDVSKLKTTRSEWDMNS
ncbi:potassium voltage-gated channel subfamily KQT member 1-like [Littorina saxatilis]|uniref:potassium voltage-gated channel subfamily KQT member 1-like n=1 Tax=Littorina saxatilis TaxID=31220 RepID=UPI0038B5A3F3